MLGATHIRNQKISGFLNLDGNPQALQATVDATVTATLVLLELTEGDVGVLRYCQG